MLIEYPKILIHILKSELNTHGFDKWKKNPLKFQLNTPETMKTENDINNSRLEHSLHSIRLHDSRLKNTG